MKKVIKIGVCFILIFFIYPVAAQLDSDVPVPSIQDWIKQHPTPQPVPQPNRFFDNGDGTVTDKKTGLIWLKNANCFGPQDLQSAKTLVSRLVNGYCGLTDKSTAGQWRLPDLAELSSLIDYGRYAADMPAGHPFLKVKGGRYYWSSTRTQTDPDDAVTVAVGHGMYIDGKINEQYGRTYVWPVRGADSD